jgi:hypothetical protein
MRCGWQQLLAALVLLSQPPAALPADTSTAAELARCADIGARESRLACYDKLAGRAADTTMQAPMAAPSRAKGGAESPAGTQGASPPAAADDDPRNFGLSQAQIHTTPQGPIAIQARIVRLVSGQLGARSYVVLDNGQTWVFTDLDEDKRMRSGDTVTIRRAALGSFALSSNSSKRTYHVRRTQ